MSKGKKNAFIQVAFDFGGPETSPKEPDLSETPDPDIANPQPSPSPVTDKPEKEQAVKQAETDLPASEEPTGTPVVTDSEHDMQAPAIAEQVTGDNEADKPAIADSTALKETNSLQVPPTAPLSDETDTVPAQQEESPLATNEPTLPSPEEDPIVTTEEPETGSDAEEEPAAANVDKPFVVTTLLPELQETSRSAEVPANEQVAPANITEAPALSTEETPASDNTAVTTTEDQDAENVANKPATALTDAVAKETYKKESEDNTTPPTAPVYKAPKPPAVIIIEEQEEAIIELSSSILSKRDEVEEEIILPPQPVPPVKTSPRGRKSIKNAALSADMVTIPPDEELFKKQYYAIGEVAAMFGENQSLIRYWETEFSILKPRKNRKGDRLFRPIDIKNLELIYDLLRRRKFTIDGAKDFLKNHKTADEKFAMVQSLQKIKSFFLELKANL